ncbi:phasin family protein [Rhizobium alvei]|jgi:phasin family protein|uniref:Phasin family protein n=1 Tax=Rhizobium alvei TaxID=1132659 RepID=A0ABT8YKH6_9HYPH|nr:phasin family protein [Rhizobium alvei]MDO6964026.1 phasin family protein [Rhizobium alvei]
MFKFDDTSAYGKEAMDSVLTSYSTAAKGFQAIAAETADYSKKSFEATVSHYEKLMATKSVEAAFELQSSFAKSSMESFIAEMSKIGEMYVDLAKGAFKPVEAAASKVAEAIETKAA